MKEHENTRTGLQRAVDLAYAARAARRILQAAEAGGLHGAAAVAVKETAPFLVKRLLAVLVALIVLPMVIFTALPNIFFGYRSSDTDAIAQMTGQAMTIGGVYMSLDDFEAAQIDSVVTGIVAEYEESGTNIDRIEVSGSVTEKDLLWIIAINSAAYQQDLNAMSADLVRNFCKSSLSYFPLLGLAEDGGDGVVTTLTVKVKHLDPDELMDELGFDKDAKQWAGALYETLEQSDAINKYRTYFETHRPDYSGDGSFSGDVEYGTDYDNQIDISELVLTAYYAGVDVFTTSVGGDGERPSLLITSITRNHGHNPWGSARVGAIAHLGGIYYAAHYVCPGIGRMAVNDELSALHNQTNFGKNTRRAFLFAGPSYHSLSHGLRTAKQQRRSGVRDRD